MKRLCRIFRIYPCCGYILSFFAIFCFSCNTYPYILVSENEIFKSAGISVNKTKEIRVWKVKPYPDNENLKPAKVVCKRYLAKSLSFSAAAVGKINNKGVDLVQSGEYSEAAVLFKEAIKEDINFAPSYNNLGVVFEFYLDKAGGDADAFDFYSKACLLEPGNECFKENFLLYRNPPAKRTEVKPEEKKD